MSRAEEGHAAEQTTSVPLNYFNYFTEIEDAFVRRRGRHLLLSPVDWALIESWKEMGVPLHVALRGIEKSFDSYEAKPRKRSVKTLMYCQEEVEAQFAEWRESQLGAAPRAAEGAQAASVTEGAGDGAVPSSAAAGGADSRSLPFPREVIAAHLSSARAALAEAAEARAAADELAEALARAAIRAAEIERDFNAAVRPDAERLEASLTDLEALLDRALHASLPAEEVEALRAEAATQLGPYKGRMGRETYEQTLDNLLAKRLREDHGVPRLSLFYL
jgi:hypothetical protein